MPTARSFHTLTLVGHVLVALGGSGPLGPLLDVHLLESPPLVAGLAQQYKLMATAAQLSATQAGLADTTAALAVTRHRAELAEQQLQVRVRVWEWPGWWVLWWAPVDTDTCARFLWRSQTACGLLPLR